MNRTLAGKFGLLMSVGAAAYMLGGPHFGDDAVILGMIAYRHGAGRRALAGLIAVFLFALCYPPVEAPFYAVCLVPLVWLWRYAPPSPRHWAEEAFAFGFAMCWLTSPFVRADFPAVGAAIQALASAIFGLQMIGFAAVLQYTRRWPLALAAPTVAAAALTCELFRVVLLGWPMLALGFPAAPTPLAQWAYYVTPFGVSYLLYLINVLCLPAGFRLSSARAWIAPLTALAVGALAWFGGEAIARRVPVGPLPFSALLVQPHRSVPEPLAAETRPETVSCVLDRLTSDALEDGRQVDLIVWPETAVGHPDDPAFGSKTTSAEPCAVRTIDQFRKWLLPKYGTACLVGAVVKDKTGLQYNSACMFERDGRTARYDKRKLVVWAERMYQPGEHYRPLRFTTRHGRAIRLGTAICYELHFPWLAPFRTRDRPDAMVLLNNESAYARYPGQHGHATWACQYRAIETRTWLLVCATWTRSAVIDPRGDVRAILPAEAGVLRVPAALSSVHDARESMDRRIAARDHPSEAGLRRTSRGGQ